MSQLTDFLLQNPVDNIKETVRIGGRLSQFEFTVTGMTAPQFARYQKMATKISKGKKVEFNNELFNQLVILNHTVEPNFKDADLIQKAGCQTPEQFINKFLLSGEQVELADRISVLSGFDSDLEEDIEQAKN